MDSAQKNMEKSEGKDHNLRNILILSVGFMLLMSAFLTMGAIEQIVLQSVSIEDPTFTGDGYISLAIIYGLFSISNFIAPVIVASFGVRTTLILGTIVYGLFITGFLYPSEWVLYGSSALLGVAAACMWVANGIYFTRCCTKETVGRNMGIYWVILSFGFVYGNAFIYWQFQGLSHIDSETRFMVTLVLTCVSALATTTLLFLGSPGKSCEKDQQKEVAKPSICSSFTEPFRMMRNKHMLLLIPTSMYTGLEIAFFTGIYPTSVGFTDAFGDDARKLVGFSGILTGIGTLLAGLIFGVFGDKVVNGKRQYSVIIACISHFVCFALIFITIPHSSPLGPTKDVAMLDPPSVSLAMLCAFLLGIADGCLMPSLFASISAIWPDNPSPALAIVRFFQAATCAAGFFISTVIGLYYQVVILGAITVTGTITFWISEVLAEKKEKGLVKPVLQVGVLKTRLSIDFNNKV